MQARVEKALDSVRNEWHEAPWFVVLIIAVAALVGPGLIFGAWTALTSLFG